MPVVLITPFPPPRVNVDSSGPPPLVKGSHGFQHRELLQVQWEAYKKIYKLTWKVMWLIFTTDVAWLIYTKGNSTTSDGERWSETQRSGRIFDHPVGEDHRDGGAVGDLHYGRYDIR
jgi:hypothetical protein